MFAFRLSVLLPFFFLLITTVNALHFYLDANEKRCFVEELPSDTVVEGKPSSSPVRSSSNVLPCLIGHYRALEWSDGTQQYNLNEELGIIVEVEVRPKGAFTTTRLIRSFCQ